MAEMGTGSGGVGMVAEMGRWRSWDRGGLGTINIPTTDIGVNILLVVNFPYW